MKLPWIVVWALHQALGQKKGDAVCSFLEGPFGAYIAAADPGHVQEVLTQLAVITPPASQAVITPPPASPAPPTTFFSAGQ